MDSGHALSRRPRPRRNALAAAALMMASTSLAGCGEAGFLSLLAVRLEGGAAPRYLFGTRPALADFAIAPFVRQFARHDAARFAQQTAPALSQWLGALLARPDFEAVMARQAVWADTGAR